MTAGDAPYVRRVTEELWANERAGGQVAEQWYSEVQRYDFSKNSGPSTGGL